MKSADISVVIPCYNVFPWLRRCVESLGRDAVPSLEILLIDDGSTDETPALCDDLAREDPRIRVIHQKNGGASAARNAGMGAATGTYLYFLDADDQLEPGALEILWNLAAVHHPDCIRFGCRRISPEGSETLWLFSEHSGLYTGPRLDELRLDAVCTPGVLDYSHPRLQAAWAVLFRRQLLAERGIAFVSEREVLNEDYLFVLQAMYAAGTVYLYNAPLYRYLYRGALCPTRPGRICTVGSCGCGKNTGKSSPEATRKGKFG